MAERIPTAGVHHGRLTVSDVDRACAFLSNGAVGLGIGPCPDPKRRGKGERFDENNAGLDHLSFAVASRKVLEDAVKVLDKRHVTHSEIRDLGEAFGIYILIFRDPDNIQLELSAPRGKA